ncbi:MAG: hypothetical protein QW795_07590 [Candidatus Bathyarchaeia archaeon]
MNNKSFIALAFASLIISLLSLSRNLNELQSFIKLILLSSLLFLIILLTTKKYWRDARSVS